jgi:hypothetical protein
MILEATYVDLSYTALTARTCEVVIYKHLKQNHQKNYNNVTSSKVKTTYHFPYLWD